MIDFLASIKYYLTSEYMRVLHYLKPNFRRIDFKFRNNTI